MMDIVRQLILDFPRLFSDQGNSGETGDRSENLSVSDRTHERLSADLMLTFICGDDRFDAQLLDASVGGAMLKCGRTPTLGSIIEMHLPEIAVPVSAEVVRVVDDSIGVKYTEQGIGVLVTG
jgi:hypothetical protein